MGNPKVLFVGGILVIAVWCVAYVVLGPIIVAQSTVNHYIMNNLSGILIGGVLEIKNVSIGEDAITVLQTMADEGKIAQADVDKMKGIDGMLLARFVFTDGSGRCWPEDCGYFPYLPTMEDSVCGAPASARIIFQSVNPTLPAAEAGTKTKLVRFVGIRFIGDKMCELGPLFEMPDEDHSLDFLTGLVGQAREVIQNVPNCTIGVFTGSNYSETDCFAAQYYSTETLYGMGPVPGKGNSTLYYVGFGSGGPVLFNTNDFATMVNLDAENSAAMDYITLMMQDAQVLSDDNLRVVESTLRRVESRINLGQ